MLWIWLNNRALLNVLDLLIVNGWSANAKFWTDFEQGIDQTVKFTVIDLDKDLNLQEYLDLIDQSVTANTLILGWSLGGSLAIQYAASSQRPFLGLVTLQTNPCFVSQDNWPMGMDKALFESLQALVMNDEVSVLSRQFSHLLVKGSDQHRSDRAYLKMVYQEGSLPSQATLLSGLALLARMDVRECLEKISLPCLHIYGAKDSLVNVQLVEKVKKLNPLHCCEIFKDMGHLPSGAYRSQIQNALNAFINARFEKVER